MKKIILKSVVISALSIFLTNSLSAQTKSTYKIRAQSRAIEKARMQNIISNAYYLVYPIIDPDIWYGYPTLRHASDRYEFDSTFDAYDALEIFEYHDNNDADFGR